MKNCASELAYVELFLPLLNKKNNLPNPLKVINLIQVVAKVG